MTIPSHVSWFKDIGLQDRPYVGGKGGSLGELQRAGIAVPAGFVVRTEAFERFVLALEQRSTIRSRVERLDPNDLQQVEAGSKELRALVEGASFPDDLNEALLEAHRELMGKSPFPVAVRSSATTEDAADASFAGLQDTFLWVTSASDMLARIRTCWASLYSVESITYRRRRNFPEAGVAMAVVVQTMVDARNAGVMFTRSPLTGDRSVITVESAWGLGSAVVGGEVTPDRWVIGKITGEISVRTVSDKAIEHLPAEAGGILESPVSEDRRNSPSMSDPELQNLRQIARQVERHYGCAQDIEWAVDRRSGQILLLQSRPETVWSMKDAAPVASAIENPLLHVMNVFGGRR